MSFQGIHSFLGGENVSPKRERGVLKTLLLASLSSIALGAGVATAQDSGEVGDEVEDDVLVRETIVVTAQKREQSLQDVGAAITAIGGDDLADQQIKSVLDIEALVPSVSVGNDFSQAKIFVRGVGLDNSFTGVDPSVALHVDGAIVSQSFAQLGSFFDLERVEVVRGPQGTLYGRNATGGSFNLISKKPTEEFEGYARFTGGNFANIIGEAAVGGPIIDDVLLARGAFRIENRGGFGENLVTGEDINDASKQSFRGHLQYNFAPRGTFLFSAEWHNEDDAGLGLTFIEPLFPDTTDPNLEVVGIGGFSDSDDPRDIASDVDFQNDSDTWSLTGTLDYDLTDNISFKSITNYRELDSRLVQDLEVSSVVTPNVQDLNTRSQHFSQELQLTYDSDRLHGLVGFYYFQEDVQSNNEIGFNPNVGDIRVSFDGELDIQSFAFFGNFTYDLTDRLALNFGARYSNEDRRLFNNGTNLPLIPLFLGFEDERSDDDFSFKAGAEYKLLDNVLVYGNYSEGFKAGAAFTGFTNPITAPERIEAFEGGIKSQFFDGRVQVNLAAFTYDIIDLQVSRTVALGPGGFTAILENVPEADSNGVELESSFYITDNFRVDVSASYLDATISTFETGDPFSLDVNPGLVEQVDLAGNTLSQSPETTFRVYAEYNLPLSNGGELQFSGDVNRKSRVFFTPFENERVSQEGQAFGNASVKYTTPSSQLSIQGWVRNISDETTFNSLFPVSTGRSIQATFNPPRTYGVTVGYNF